MFWSPRADPAVLTLVAAFDPPFGRSLPAPEFRTRRLAPEGHHAIHGSLVATQILLRPGTEPGLPLAVLMPLDADLLSRIESLRRLWRDWQHLSVPPDTRITAQRRRRLRLVLRAADGRDNGASYREIATAIYGAPRVAAEPWKTSPLRDTVIGLVESAAVLIGGGYLQLLRHRRRP